QGLGYYSRARNLRAAAREVVERFGGVFPRSLDDVRSLRGVGDYTAAAICSAAYDAPCAVVDGNVYR
ncbi:MAG TPA: A/G-specific adenine glycosylase, partial [Alistipes sp.]|nr:A/G-specific adenine glycosylase [Alistipes sp.]